MQNRYVGDIGDFGKYGLLKVLCQPSHDKMPQLSLGVAWYLVPDEGHNNDGKHVAYLDPIKKNIERFKNCDSFLYEELSKIVRNGERNIKSIRQSSILPHGTIYYETPLTFNGMATFGSSAYNRRLVFRKQWVNGALELTKTSDVVFIDPDNGIEVGIERHHARGPKYVYFDELSPYLQRGQSLIIYHHIGRNGTAEEQIQKRFLQIKQSVGNYEGTFALLYHRGTLRCYFIVPQEQHKDTLFERSKVLTSGIWAQHFSRINPNP